MENVTLSASVRTSIGKNEARRTRMTGKIPAILYGQDKAPQMLQINQHELNMLLQRTRGESVLIDLSVEDQAADGPTKIYLKDIQRDPVSGKIVHADLLSVSLTETVDLEIPIHFVGNAPGVKDAGIVEFLMRTLEIRSLPQNAPRFIEVSLEPLKIGSSIHVSDLVEATKGLEILSDPDATVAICVAPSVEEVVAPVVVEGAEPAEPEIIGKGKKEDEEEEEVEKKK